MPDPQKPGAVLFAKDIARVAKFYAGVIPMTVTLERPDLIVLQSTHSQLVVHPIPAEIARSVEIADPPERRTNVPVKLIFPVASLAEARAGAPALGGALNPPEKEFAARGFRACDGHDPEGNVVQLRENAP
jgi:predicted enzyme related to lactoylglutathione lyase